MKKNLRKIKTDQQAEELLDNDFSPYLHRGNFQKVSFEFQAKNKVVTMRLSEELLKAIKVRAKEDGISYQKLIRRVLERFLCPS